MSEANVVDPAHSATSKADPENEEYRRNQRRGAQRAGFREFSSCRGGGQRSRGSLNIVARRGGGTDCAPDPAYRFADLCRLRKKSDTIPLKYHEELTPMELLFTLAGLVSIVVALYILLSQRGKRLSFKVKCLIFSALVFCMTALWCIVYGPELSILIQAGVIIVVATLAGFLSSHKP
ncbi:hypothetical protein [Rhizobium multihospitium]|uniref:Uncharacterized protein n=1 Tax=Rhizobium multihospitium TaxID=410764 RepID=A0A1C3XB71_9HYPH|nr:hypothetical protein [Rhizobium multihospitium]SCB49537.1 hypothetical protein GA0061103_0613 [Rhizobium multihospitium]